MQVIKNDDGEKILVASRNLRPEDFIVMEAPLVMGPRQLSEPLCLGCYRTITGKYK